jgi:hypothetical protein
MTQESLSQQSIAALNTQSIYSVKQQMEQVIFNALTGTFLVGSIKRIPIAPLLDSLRRISGKEDEAEFCMEYIRKEITDTYSAEIGRTGDDDANYIIIYPKGQRPADFRKSKTNTLTVVELVKVALHSLENEVKPYGSYNGIKVTRSNLTTAREIATVIRDALPSIKILTFAEQYTSSQIDEMIAKLTEVKKNSERNEAIQVLKERGFTETQINRLFPQTTKE